MAEPAARHPDRFETLLSAGALLMLGIVLVAILRGYADWSRIGAAIWLHLATIGIALALTPAILLRRRGDALHRALGWIWCCALLVTALVSFGIRGINQGGLSPIHLLSAWTIVQVPWIIWTARTRRVAAHRRAVRGMVTGALLVAGFFTLPFGRLLGNWLLG
jgi:uncharacterized membrane protein